MRCHCFLATIAMFCGPALAPVGALNRELLTKSSISCGLLNVFDYGAKGDGKTLDTVPIVETFKAAEKLGPHCTVFFPPGHIFLSAPINITASTNIHISEGSTLRFPSDRELHPIIEDKRFGGKRYQPLLFCEYGCPGVLVTGKGKVDGDGPGWWPPVPSGMRPSKELIPPYTFECNKCDGLEITNLLVAQCPFTCIHAHNSTDVLITAVTVTNPIDSPNTACVYIDSLTNAKITKSRFSCGDDHITVLAITRRTVNVTVEDSVFYHGQGLTLGSQVYHGMTDVTYRNSVMIGALTGIRLKAQRKLGGDIVNLLYENIQLRSVGIMISVEMDYKHDGVVSKNPPTFNGVTLRNITGWGDLASFIKCLPESPCKGWVLDSVFPDNTSEVVLPYYCEHFHGTCKNCGDWPQRCPGLEAV